MRQGWSWGRVAGGLIGLGLAACASGSSDDQDSGFIEPPGEYFLGGQTGSLVPDCGVAPLSAGGISVPVGDALAVVYAWGCPGELAAEQLALTGPGQRPVALTLETLGDDTYLVRATESLAGGTYALRGAGEPSVVSVADEVSPLPLQLGELRPVASPLSCPDDLVFELRLSPEAQAHAPLLRWLVRVDGGLEQLWVDYGALELEALGAERARLRLPRCALSSCLGDGAHQLRVRAELAGETLASAELSVGFDVPCPAASSASDSPASDSGCSLRKARSSPLGSMAWLCGVAAAVLAARRRRY